MRKKPEKEREYSQENEIKLFEKVLPYLKRNIKSIIFGLIVLVIVDAVQLAIPLIMRSAIDGIAAEQVTQSQIALYSLLILLMAGVIALMRYFWRILIVGTSWKIEKGLRGELYSHLLRLSQSFFNKAKIGDLMAHSTNDMNAVRMLFGMGLIAAADIIIMTLAAIIFMISINVRLTLYAIIPLPLLSLAISYFGRRIHYRFRRVQESFSDLSGVVQESISGIRVVKAFAQEDPERRKMNNYSEDYLVNNIKMAKLSGLFHPFSALIISLSMVIVLIFGGSAAIEGVITIGDYVAFTAYLNMLVWPMMAIGWIVELYQRGTASLKRINKLLGVKEDVSDKDADRSITELRGDIEVRNLTFSYPVSEEASRGRASGRLEGGKAVEKDEEAGIQEGEIIPEKVFDNISFKLEAGKTLAIVGRTGCGKSTLVELITRIYNPPQNTIFIDGHEIHTIPLEVLRRDIVIVPQEIFLFSDTIANNIRFGKPEASREEVEEVAALAQIDKEIRGFEDGFDTVIGERGVTLSGGQKQRLAISRALLLGPNTLIMDDSLSAVDTKTEKRILEHLIKIRKTRTTIIAAHRISSLQHAHKIIVMDKGQIVERGTHSQLLVKKGIYWDIYEKQQLKESIERR